MGRHLRRAINSLRCGEKVPRLGLINARHKLLRIAVNHRKPGGLNLNHDAMSSEKYMIVVSQWDFELGGTVRNERFGIRVALIKPSAPNLHRNWQLISVHRLLILAGLGTSLRIPVVLRGILWINVNELDYKVSVRPGSGGKDVGPHLAGNCHVVV